MHLLFFFPPLLATALTATCRETSVAQKSQYNELKLQSTHNRPLAKTDANHSYSSPGESMSQGTTCQWFSVDISHDNMWASGYLQPRVYGQLHSCCWLPGILAETVRMPRRATRSFYRLGYVFSRNWRYPCPLPSRIACTCICSYDGRQVTFLTPDALMICLHVSLQRC